MASEGLANQDGSVADVMQGNRIEIAVAAGVVCLTGLLCLAMPFWGDQTIFTLYSREMTRGAVLYRDVFDLKQPGIFLFYAAGGLLFGFSEVGIHAFELVYWVLFCVFACTVLRPYFVTARHVVLVPIFTVGAYFCYAGLLDLGQIEAIIGFPLLAIWWLIDRAEREPRGWRRYAAAGILSAWIVLLKHLYLLLALAFVGRAVVRRVRAGSDVLVPLAAFGAALVLSLAPVVAYFAAHGQLERIWWAYFQMAPAAQLLTPRPIEYLVTGARRFLIGFAPMLILGAVGVRRAIDGRTVAKELVLAMCLWIAAGVVAFPVLQGWPEYKWTLFAFPVGILAAVGADGVLSRPSQDRAVDITLALLAAAVCAVMVCAVAFDAPRRQTYAVLVLLLAGVSSALVLPACRRPIPHRIVMTVLVVALGGSVGLTAITPIKKVITLRDHDFALSARGRTELQYALNGGYRAADADLNRLGRPIDDSDIFVFGDPVLYLRARRPQPVPILGWGPEFLDARGWRELNRDLRKREPRYVVVSDPALAVMEQRCPPILQWLKTEYHVAFVGESGTWYQRP